MKRMGINFSEPIPNFGEDLGYLAIVVRCRDRIRLLHAPKSVVEMVQGILRYDCLLLFYEIFSKNRIITNDNLELKLFFRLIVVNLLVLIGMDVIQKKIMEP